MILGVWKLSYSVVSLGKLDTGLNRPSHGKPAIVLVAAANEGEARASLPFVLGLGPDFDVEIHGSEQKQGGVKFHGVALEITLRETRDPVQPEPVSAGDTRRKRD